LREKRRVIFIGSLEMRLPVVDHFGAWPEWNWLNNLVPPFQDFWVAFHDAERTHRDGLAHGEGDAYRHRLAACLMARRYGGRDNSSALRQESSTKSVVISRVRRSGMDDRLWGIRFYPDDYQAFSPVLSAHGVVMDKEDYSAHYAVRGNIEVWKAKRERMFDWTRSQTPKGT
jgi:hypothetical protein